ncbi:hypothetical protein C0993_008562, partial [Termitomyces sp. T159_Od127]
DVLLHAWPKVSPGDELKGLTDPGMSIELVVMVLVENVQADLLVVQDIDLSVLEKESVVGAECEGAVVVGVVCEGVPGVVLSEEGVSGGIADLVNGIIGGVTFENDGESRVKVAEDGGGSEGFFEEGEHALAFAISVPWSVLSHELVEEFGDPGVIINEPAVEVGKTKK